MLIALTYHYKFSVSGKLKIVGIHHQAITFIPTRWNKAEVGSRKN